MRYLSLFSGIEACSVAWAPLGWECVAVAEIEPWPSRVLAHHYPDVPNLGDVTKVTEEQIAMLGRIDVVVFGSPCQDLSVAGKRKGLDGARSGLFFTAMQIVGWARQWCDCRFALWENVPGAFSSNAGRDFAAVVDAMAGLEGTGVPPKGWGTEGCALGAEAMVEWSTLDAQWFGVAQRRRRVFALADFGDWRNRPPILLEPESVRGDTAPRREAGQDVAGTLASRTRGGGFPGSDGACSGYVRPVLSEHCLNAGGMGRIDYETETMIVTSEVVSPTLVSGSTSPAAHGKKNGTDREALVSIIPFDTTQITSAANYSNPRAGDPCHPLAAGAHPPAIAFNSNAQPDEMKFDEHVSATLTCSQYSAVAVRDVSPTLTGNYGKQVDNSDTALGPNVVFPNARVRRLTPVECEKLQGFPAVSEKITIEACLDHQNQSVRAVLKCLRWQNSVLSVEENGLTQFAKTAGALSNINQACHVPLAALHVRMHSVDELLAIRSAGRLIWSANGAGQSKKSLPPTLTESSVQELARLLREVARTITAGRAVSQQSISLSFPASSGATSAEKSGLETKERASVVTSDQSKATFTTSDLGLITMCSDSTAETLCCSVLHAIAGCIPSTTLPETFSIELTLETPYTAVPDARGKPSADGPRYKALGNSMAVPVMRWIGRSIDYAMIWSTP